MTAPPILRGARWPAQGNKQTFAEAMLELALENPCKGICARCGECFEGTFRAEREWFLAHVCRGLIQQEATRKEAV